MASVVGNISLAYMPLLGRRELNSGFCTQHQKIDLRGVNNFMIGCNHMHRYLACLHRSDAHLIFDKNIIDKTTGTIGLMTGQCRD